MNTITKTIFTTAMILSLGIGANSSAFAKGHNQGFGAGTAGQDTAGLVDDGQSNRDGNGSETSYGLTDAVIDAKDGVAGNSVAARDKTMNHPSMKAGRGQ
ncbi:MAG: hypothetical protein ACK4P4_00755 [Allorhizobium sp.]